MWITQPAYQQANNPTVPVHTQATDAAAAAAGTSENIMEDVKVEAELQKPLR